jgi:hypothetical protein
MPLSTMLATAPINTFPGLDVLRLNRCLTSGAELLPL